MHLHSGSLNVRPLTLCRIYTAKATTKNSATAITVAIKYVCVHLFLFISFRQFAQNRTSTHCIRYTIVVCAVLATPNANKPAPNL